MSQFKTYCFLFASNGLHNCFNTNGMITAISDFKWGIDDRVMNECCIIGLPSGVRLFYCCGRLNIGTIPSEHMSCIIVSQFIIHTIMWFFLNRG